MRFSKKLMTCLAVLSILFQAAGDCRAPAGNLLFSNAAQSTLSAPVDGTFVTQHFKGNLNRYLTFDEKAKVFEAILGGGRTPDGRKEFLNKHFPAHDGPLDKDHIAEYLKQFSQFLDTDDPVRPPNPVRVSVDGMEIPFRDFFNMLEAARDADGFRPIEKFLQPEVSGLLKYLIRKIQKDEFAVRTKEDLRNIQREFFDYFLFFHLAQLTLRIWDDGPRLANENLKKVEALLNSLQQGEHASGRMFSIKAGHLLMLAISKPTAPAQISSREKAEPYFKLSEKIRRTLSREYQLQYFEAAASMISQHVHSEMFSAWEVRFDGDWFFSVRDKRRAENTDVDFTLALDAAVVLLEDFERLKKSHRHAASLRAEEILSVLSVDADLFLEPAVLLRHTVGDVPVMVEEMDATRRVLSREGEYYARRYDRFFELLRRNGDDLKRAFLEWDPENFLFSPIGVTISFAYQIVGSNILKSLVHRDLKDLPLETAWHASNDERVSRLMVRDEIENETNAANRPVNAKFHQKFAKNEYDHFMRIFEKFLQEEETIPKAESRFSRTDHTGVLKSA